jgi:L-fucose isomerase-like protein
MFKQDKRLIPRVAVSSLSSPLEVGASRAPRAAKDLAAMLGKAGCEVVELENIGIADLAVAAGRLCAEKHVDAVALASASWFEDYLVTDLLEECRVPLLLWSLPGMETGALCGTQQLTAVLRQLDEPFDCVYGPLAEGENLARATTFLRAAALYKRLRRARIGFGGHRVAGMTEVSANEIALKRCLGPRIVPLDLPQLLATAEAMPAEQARKAWKVFSARSAACKVGEDAGLDSMRVHAAVDKLVVQHRLDALTIGCYPHLMGRVCLAASLLADEGVPLGCEGDVNGAVGQLMLTLLTGEPTHNNDWLEPLDDGSVIFTHCGSGSLSLAEKPSDITLASVRLMGQGVCALFPARPGPVTLVSLMPVGNEYQLALLEGEALSTGMVFPGNPLRVRFAAPTPKIIDCIHDEGIGHHWMAGYGHVGGEIRQWAKIAGEKIRLVEP